MNSGQPTLDREKLEQVILFFLERINNNTLGRTKLMKLLYYVDFDHYQKTGRSITNAKYRKLPQGPVPDKAEKVIEAMIKRNAVKAVKTTVGDFVQHRLLTSGASFDASRLQGDELETVTMVARKWEHASAAQIATATHREAPWGTTEDGKAIDYELANYRSLPAEEEEDQWLAKSKELREIVSSLG
jgi:uncharacterized phage-associated protein